MLLVSTIAKNDSVRIPSLSASVRNAKFVSSRQLDQVLTALS